MRTVIYSIIALLIFIFTPCAQSQGVVDLAGQLSGTAVSEFASEVCGYSIGDEQLTVPEGVSVIPAFAFAGAMNLKRVNLPESLEEIGAHAFAYCAGVKEVIIPKGVRRVRQCAFVLCESLEEIELPDQVTELESYAFAQCSQLRKAVLPANGSLLGELIFSCCDRLSEIVELSGDVPMFDCNSTLFDADDSSAWQRCRLVVAAGMKPSYSDALGWRDFMTIIEKK